SAPMGQLRQRVSIRSWTRRKRVREEPPRAFRHYCEMRCTMTQTLTRALVALTFAAMAVRPAYAANKEQQQLAADIRILQQQAQQLQNLIGSMNTALTEALKAVNARNDEQTSANRKPFADKNHVIVNI